MYHKLFNKSSSFIILLCVHLIICKSEFVNSNLIKRIYESKGEVRSSKMNLIDTISGSLHNSLRSSLYQKFKKSIKNLFLNGQKLSNDIFKELDIRPTVPKSSDSSGDLLGTLPLAIDSSFVITKSLPKNIPLKLPKSSESSTSRLNYSSPQTTFTHSNSFTTPAQDQFRSQSSSFDQPQNLYTISTDKSARKESTQSPFNQNNEKYSMMRSSTSRPVVNSIDDNQFFNTKSSEIERNHHNSPDQQIISNNMPTGLVEITSPHTEWNRNDLFKSNIDSASINESPLGALPFDNQPLPIDSPLLFNTSLIKNKPVIGLPNTALSTMNFYYLVDDRSDSIATENQVRSQEYLDYLKRECEKLKQLNKINEIKSLVSSTNQLNRKDNDFSQNDSRKNQIFNLNSLRKTFVSSSKTSTKSPKKSKKSIRKSGRPRKSPPKYKKNKKRKSSSPKPQKMALVRLQPIDSILSHQSNNILNYHNNLLNLPAPTVQQPLHQIHHITYEPVRLSNRPVFQPNFPVDPLAANYPNHMVVAHHKHSRPMNNKNRNQVHRNKSNKGVLFGAGTKKKSNKKRKQQLLVNSSTNDQFIVTKVSKSSNTKSKNKISKTNKPKRPSNKDKSYSKSYTKSYVKSYSKSYPKSLPKSINKPESSTKPPVVYKNVVYVNQKKDPKGQMLDAFHQSTLEEDLNIIKEIISDYNKLANNDPIMNQYYLTNNNNQVIEDNYIVENLVDLPHQSLNQQNKYGNEKMKKPVHKHPTNKKKNKPIFKNSGRKYPFFGFPLSNVHSNDMFDQETTYEEKMFEKYYPWRHGVNPGIRELIKRILEWEAKVTQMKGM